MADSLPLHSHVPQTWTEPHDSGRTAPVPGDTGGSGTLRHLRDLPGPRLPRVQLEGS